jgi:hypothetical protein
VFSSESIYAFRVDARIMHQPVKHGYQHPEVPKQAANLRACLLPVTVPCWPAASGRG